MPHQQPRTPRLSDDYVRRGFFGGVSPQDQQHLDRMYGEAQAYIRAKLAYGLETKFIYEGAIHTGNVIASIDDYYRFNVRVEEGSYADDSIVEVFNFAIDAAKSAFGRRVASLSKEMDHQVSTEE